VVTSTICQAEIMMGAARHPAAGLGHFFNAVPALPFDEAAADAYAGLPFRRGSFDRLIAAHSLSRALILVTANPRDFVDLPGLCIEDWTQP
jgi:tRNA(fMet)-specific endonuclease VapC